jgi:hypothetical protein
MREVIGAIVGAILVSAVFTHDVIANENNEAMKGCLVINGYTPEKFDTFDFTKASYCYQKYKIKRNAEELAELRDFLKHNPRYRYPGQSNNRCWGKPREMPFESAGIEMSDRGMKAWVNYKDKLPAGCFENAPWDNRDVKG